MPVFTVTITTGLNTMAQLNQKLDSIKGYMQMDSSITPNPNEPIIVSNISNQGMISEIDVLLNKIYEQYPEVTGWGCVGVTTIDLLLAGEVAITNLMLKAEVCEIFERYSIPYYLGEDSVLVIGPNSPPTDF